MASIILLGNLSDGFRAVGPFVDHDEAADATSEAGWIMTLETLEPGTLGRQVLFLDQVASAATCPTCACIMRTWDKYGNGTVHFEAYGAAGVCETCWDR